MRYHNHFLLLLFLFIASMVNAQGWKNPMTLGNQEWMGIGDPYIMKYRGVYYLYSSATLNVQCWTSTDLVNWTDAVTVCFDEVANNAYAPEVKYWNGKFYMCTSPAGKGHYILTSDSPLGPFVHVTGNMDYEIDGSFFVDDDGSWYFYHASFDGILGNKMPSHQSLGSDVNLGAQIDGQWTEGPGVFKRNGIYYLLYTGNHVLTDGYRIDYAMNTEGPLAKFSPQKEQNPILVDAETSVHRGLGHGSAFIGPDLDSYYFCYHNLNRYGNGSTNRNFNIDRIGWNGDKLMMYGPTFWTQDAPAIADCDYFNRRELEDNWIAPVGKWSIVNQNYLSQTNDSGDTYAVMTAYSYDNYTAELTLKAEEDQTSGQIGVIFSYADSLNYSKATINVRSRRLEVKNVTGGTTTSLGSATLPTDFNARCWHSVRIEKDGKTAKIYVDDMHKVDAVVAETCGSIGYLTRNCKADFSYTAISKYVNGNGIYDVSLPVPGMIAAYHAAEKTDGVTIEEKELPDGGMTNSLVIPAGNKVTYNVNTHSRGSYNVGIRYFSLQNSTIRILQNGVVKAERKLPPTDDQMGVAIIDGVKLLPSHHKLEIEVEDGQILLYELNIRQGLETAQALSDNFDNGISDDWNYKEGNWSAVDGKAQIAGYGKLLMGRTQQGQISDYTIECDVTYTEGMNAGLIFRVTNPSTGGANDSPSLGSDFLQGYFFSLAPTYCILGRQNFGWETLMTTPDTYEVGKTYHLKVEAEGATFRCYVDGELKITKTDPIPFIQGRAGFRSHNCTALFDNFSFMPMYTDTEIEKPEVKNDALNQGVTIYNTAGQVVSFAKEESNLDKLPRGLYVVENGKTRYKKVNPNK